MAQENSGIDGVRIIKLEPRPDDRGVLIELCRESSIGPIKQVTFSVTNPGVIKAFHWHKKQQDAWVFISGQVRVVLYDLRENSPTWKKTQVIYAGDFNRVAIIIPPYVAHGYQVLGNDPAFLVYAMSEEHDHACPDEERMPFKHPEIGFDWSIKNR